MSIHKKNVKRLFHGGPVNGQIAFVSGGPIFYVALHASGPTLGSPELPAFESEIAVYALQDIYSSGSEELKMAPSTTYHAVYERTETR